MKRYLFTLSLLCVNLSAFAQVPVTAAADQQVWLKSADPKLAANKKLAFDFWREVLQARNMELADKYMTENYIQHNPNVPTGRAAFKETFGRMGPPQPVQDKIVQPGPLVSIVAEGDRVIFNFVYERPDPVDGSKKYTTTWFDMFRIENGKIAEHWDSMLKMPPPPPPAK